MKLYIYRDKGMRIIIRIVSATTFFLITTQAFSYYLPPGYLLAQVGGYLSSPGESQNIGIKGLVGDRFTADNSNNGNVLFGLGYFLNGLERDQYSLDYGINAFYLAKTTVSGDIIQEHLYANLSYGYDISHVPIYLDAKASIKIKTNTTNQYAVTVDAGIGPNFLMTSHYQDESIDNGVTKPDNAFSGQTNTTFSATAGIGIKIDNLINHIPVECGYRFFYLGQGNLSKNKSQLQDTLSIGTVYANAIICSVAI